MWLRLPTYCHSAPELVDSISESTERYETLARSVSWRGKPSPSHVWKRRCAKSRWLTHLSGLILRASTARRGVGAWISSLRASRVRTSVQLVNDEESKQARDPGYGFTSPGSSTSVDPNGSSSKTSPRSCETDSTLSSRRLPKSGSMRNGVLSPRPLAVQLLAVSDGSCWPTLRVATAQPLNAGKTIRRWLTRGLLAYQYPDIRILISFLLTGHPPQVILRLTPTSPELDRISFPVIMNPTFAEWLQGFPIGWTETGL